MNSYKEFAAIWTGGNTETEYIIHVIEDSLKGLAKDTSRIIITNIKPDEAATALYSFTTNSYVRLYGSSNIEVSAMKKAFKELKKVKCVAKLPTGKVKLKYFDYIKIPMFGDTIQYRLNAAAYPYMKNFRR